MADFRALHLAALALLLAPIGVQAVVIRDDVPDADYRMAPADFPALADLPGEGHGVLIAPEWVATAAHAVSWQGGISEVSVGGMPRAVRRVVVHPGYKAPPTGMVEAALASGDWEAFFDFMAGVDDLALIQLAEPVQEVAPVRIQCVPQVGALVRIIGRGATGDGATGYPLQANRRGELRQGYNQLTVSEGRWVAYRFDAPPAAHPLEATTGNGDSGGPILVAEGDGWRLAGLAAWKRSLVKGTDVLPGRYGEISYGVRLAHYAGWISETLAAPADGD